MLFRSRISDGLRPTGHSVARVDDRVVVRGSCPVFGGTWCSVNYTIEVPRGLDVTIKADGHVEVFGIDGDVRASTDQGSITLDHLAGDVREFVDALRRVAGGGTVLDPEVVAAVMARQQPVERLTPREREVLALMAEGRTNTAIAASLVVTDRAVEKHVANIFTKLDLPPSGEDHRRVLAVLRWLDG